MFGWFNDSLVRELQVFPTAFVNTILWARTQAIFHDCCILAEVAIGTIESIYKNFKNISKIKKNKIRIMPPLLPYTTWEFFDGPGQGHLMCYNVGGVIFFHQNHHILIQYCHGFGINMNVEFTSLRTLLYATNFRSICKMQIMGDSKFVIDKLDNKVFIEALVWNISYGMSIMK